MTLSDLERREVMGSADLRTYARTVWQTAIKIGMPILGRRMLLEDSHDHVTRGRSFSASEFFRDSLYTKIPFELWTDQFRQVTDLGRGVFIWVPSCSQPKWARLSAPSFGIPYLRPHSLTQNDQIWRGNASREEASFHADELFPQLKGRHIIYKRPIFLGL